MPRIFSLLIVALLVAVALAPAAAQASPNQISIMQDDDLLLYRDDNTAARTLQKMKELGVDTIRVTVLWKVVDELANPSKAEINARHGAAKSKLIAQGKRFRAANPKTYPTRNWDRYDNLVKEATKDGIQVYFNVTGPGPAWAMGKAPKAFKKDQATWMPSPGAFKAFVTAVGTRFSGSYRDENAGRQILPAVKFWTLWNEPNQAGWLTPQWKSVNGQQVPASPALYRKLYQFGYRGLLASGHGNGDNVILLGETAPLGSDAQTDRSPMRPGLFLRELACVDGAGVPYTGAAAAARSCGDIAKYGPLKAVGYAHHPYTKNVSPTQVDPNPDSLTMANINSLGTLLDNLSTITGGYVPGNLPLFMTEFGFETNPPDPFNGIDLNAQAAYDQIGEFQAYSNPRILSQSQFQYRDVAPVKSHPKTSKAYWFTYQSGLYFLDGTPKPSANAYILPFIGSPGPADPATGAPTASFWGQLRFLPNGLAGQNAIIQWRATPGAGDWTSIGAGVPVGPRGYFTASEPVPAPGGEWRAVWDLPDGTIAVTSLSSPAT